MSTPATVGTNARIETEFATFGTARSDISEEIGVGSGIDNPMALRSFLRSWLFAMIQDYRILDSLYSSR